MKVSVIVPVFNVEDFLRDCITSVLNQSYKNFELVLVDDGSTDGSDLICDEYCEMYSEYVRIFHISNGGPLRARLIGVSESMGDVLIFLDADDCLKNNALSEIVSCFETNDCDMVLYNAGRCERFFSLSIVHSLKDGQIFERDNKYELYKKIIQGHVPNSVCLKAIRRECAHFPEYFMDFTMRHGEDLLLSANFITNCDKIVYLGKGLYYYRDRPGSAIHSFNMKRKESIKLVHTELDKYINQWGLSELKSLHDARKVRGWMDNLKLLLKNKQYMEKNEFRKEMVDMSTDPYFVDAYHNMDASTLSVPDRFLAYFLYKRRYGVVFLMYFGKRVLAKVKVK